MIKNSSKNFRMKMGANYQTGQTLVETMVAALVLVIGIGASVSLAIYGLNATTGVSKQLIGVGLAREGVEAVKNMRDTNWLRDSLEPDCSNFYTGGDDAQCYYRWLNYNYDINPGGITSYALSFDATVAGNQYWQLVPTNSEYGLDYNPKNPEFGLYTNYGRPLDTSSGDSGFARRITLTVDDSFGPFLPEYSTGPRLKVAVDVWWTDKRCPILTEDPPTVQSCKVTLETYLTNWKDY